VAAAQRYLSRGLWEALLAFIHDAQAGDELCVAIYEYHHDSVVEELQAAIDRGVRVRLLYHAKAGEEALRSDRISREQAGRLRPSAKPGSPTPEIRPRRNVQGISHNKFVVHKRAGVPARVWTGSTNFTDAGFFLQTNVGLVLRDQTIAGAYVAYFDLLFADPQSDALKPALGTMDLRFDGQPASRAFFSPVAGDELLRVAADMISGARDAVLISCPFGLEQEGAIIQAIKALDRRVIVLGLMNTNQRGNLSTLDGDSRDAQEFAVPDWIKRLNGEEYDPSTGAGNQIHVKSLVVDPWGLRPRILLGSSNFSDESVNQNDENALLIEGDRWAAAIVATEFLRVFEHYKFRNHIRDIADLVDTQARPQERAFGGWAGGILSGEQPAAPPEDEWFLDLDALGAPDGPRAPRVLGAIERAEYWLCEDDSWVASYFEVGNARCREREAFAP
jgi:phosphatidylserine/phosphatidylglycerophosphate/cardiolipin synthase-like enzyme